MAINVICLRCAGELTEPGGLLFSPPLPGTDWMVAKDHLCNICYPLVMAWIRAKMRIVDKNGQLTMDDDDLREFMDPVAHCDREWPNDAPHKWEE